MPVPTPTPRPPPSNPPHILIATLASDTSTRETYAETWRPLYAALASASRLSYAHTDVEILTHLSTSHPTACILHGTAATRLSHLQTAMLAYARDEGVLIVLGSNAPRDVCPYAVDNFFRAAGIAWRCGEYAASGGYLTRAKKNVSTYGFFRAGFKLLRVAAGDVWGLEGEEEQQQGNKKKRKKGLGVSGTELNRVGVACCGFGEGRVGFVGAGEGDDAVVVKMCGLEGCAELLVPRMRQLDLEGNEEEDEEADKGKRFCLGQGVI